MRLQTVLDGLRFLAELISPRHWGEDLGSGEAGPVRCTHILSRQFIFDGATGELKRNKRGEFIEHVRRCKVMAPEGFDVCHLHGGPTGIKPSGKGGGLPPDPMRLVCLRADVNREIDGLPPRPRRMFDLLYRAPLPIGSLTLKQWHDEGHQKRYVSDVIRAMGYDGPQAFWMDHLCWVAQIERKLIHHFPEARNAA